MHRLPPARERDPGRAGPAGLRRLPPLTRRRALVRSLLLATAAELFRQRGYRATTLDDIAGRLGMSKATLYRYFRSKEDLLFAIFQRTVGLFETELRQVRRSRQGPAEQLRRVIHHHVRTVIAEQAFLTVFFAEEASLPPRLARAIRRRKAAYDRGVQAIVESGRRRGLFAGVEHPRLTVFAILGMCNWVHKWFRPSGPWDAAGVAEAFIRLVEPGYLRAVRRHVDLRRSLARISREIKELRPLVSSPRRSARRRRARP